MTVNLFVGCPHQLTLYRRIPQMLLKSDIIFKFWSQTNANKTRQLYQWIFCSGDSCLALWNILFGTIYKLRNCQCDNTTLTKVCFGNHMLWVPADKFTEWKVAFGIRFIRYEIMVWVHYGYGANLCCNYTWCVGVIMGALWSRTPRAR